MERGYVIMTIQDSGNRTEFESGAVRDCGEGKGRCDLLPLDIVASHLDDRVITFLGNYQKTANPACLAWALGGFLANAKCPFRNAPDMYLEVSKHFEEGAKKYSERNWEKGIPEERYIDSAVRHYLKWLRGDTDERHDRAFVWNVICLMWTHKHITEKVTDDVATL